MKKLIVLILVMSSGSSFAQELHTFSNGDVADAEALIGRHQIHDALRHNGSVRNHEGGSTPPTSPAATFGGQWPLFIRIVMVIGIVSHRDGGHSSLVIHL